MPTSSIFKNFTIEEKDLEKFIEAIEKSEEEKEKEERKEEKIKIKKIEEKELRKIFSKKGKENKT